MIVSAIGLQGNGMVVKFNSDGDAPGSYDIFQYQRVGKESNFMKTERNTRFDYVSIGEWANERYVHSIVLQIAFPSD